MQKLLFLGYHKTQRRLVGFIKSLDSGLIKQKNWL
jgi:hypothetical protein